jgi:hypothetical protein
MTGTFYLTQGSLLPSLAVVLTNDDTGEPADLTEASAVQFTMRRVGDTDDTITRAAAIVPPATDGQVGVDWQAGDLDVAGEYAGLFLVTVGGKTQPYPGAGYIRIVVQPDLVADGDDPPDTLVFATAADAREKLGRDIPADKLVLAQTMVEMRTGILALTSVTDPVDPDAVPTQWDDLLDGDKYWIKLATIFQAAYIEPQPDTLTREALRSASADGESKTYAATSAALGPFAEWALRSMSAGCGGMSTIETLRVDPADLTPVPWLPGEDGRDDRTWYPVGRYWGLR